MYAHKKLKYVYLSIENLVVELLRQVLSIPFC
jgi:hypothetical protein